MKERQVFKFGNFTLDPVAKVLFRDSEPIHLTRKGVETLLVLVENSGRVLTKEEIMSAVWTDRVVDEANLAQNIAVVRKALGAPKGHPAHIETFPGRGYRLEGPVISLLETPVPPLLETPFANGSPKAADTITPPLVDDAPPRSRRPPAVLPIVLVVSILLAGVILWSMMRASRRPAEFAFRVIPTTRMPGKEYQPVITRDGKRIAFLSAEDGLTLPSVWVQDSDGGSSRQLTKGGEHHSSPTWSPDGSRVAFLRIQRTAMDVVIANVDGSSERIVAQFAIPTYGFDNRMLDWSPDGEYLAVSHAAAPGGSLGLSLVRVSSGAQRSITIAGAGVLGDVDPRFSPDGKVVTFLRWIHRSQQEIFAVPIEGQTKRITNLGKRISSHDWMRDGNSIVFASDRRGDFRLWRMRIASNDGGETAVPLGIYSEFSIQFSTARNADSLAYSSLQQDRNIWRLEMGTLQWKRIIASSGQDASPQYSPDGRRICFRSDRSGEEQLWVSNADGSDAAQITSDSVRPSVGRWSHDGSAIVFNSPQTGDVYVATVQSDRTWSVRSTGIQGVHPVFSLDGRWIYAGGPGGIVRFALSEGKAESVVQTKAEALALSADGKYIYFVREPNDTAIWRLDLSTLATTRVLNGLVPGCTSCWALANEGLYYLGSDKQSFDKQILFFHDLKSARERVVTMYPEPLWPQGSGPFSMSPDGKSLLCVRVEPSKSDVMLVTPFR